MKIAKRIASYVRPIYIHDCTACLFLGRLEKEDLYFCPLDNSYIRRYGSKPRDNGSLGTLCPEGSAYSLAKRLHQKRLSPCHWIVR